MPKKFQTDRAFMLLPATAMLTKRDHQIKQQAIANTFFPKFIGRLFASLFLESCTISSGALSGILSRIIVSAVGYLSRIIEQVRVTNWQWGIDCSQFESSHRSGCIALICLCHGMGFFSSFVAFRWISPPGFVQGTCRYERGVRRPDMTLIVQLLLLR